MIEVLEIETNIEDSSGYIKLYLNIYLIIY
jgi:hypothetical protein